MTKQNNILDNMRDHMGAQGLQNEALKSSNMDVTAAAQLVKGSQAKAKAAAKEKAADLLTIPQLMARLAALWPRAFPSAASIEAWSAEYQRTLGSLNPAPLAQGWGELMQGWNKAGHPMPADIRQAVLQLPEEVKPGENMKEFFEKATLGSKQLVMEWKKKHAALLQELGTRHQPADDPRNSHLIRVLERLAKEQAWMLAQQHLRGANLDLGVEISPQVIEENRHYVDRLYGPPMPTNMPPNMPSNIPKKTFSSPGAALPVGQPLSRVIASLQVPQIKPGSSE